MRRAAIEEIQRLARHDIPIKTGIGLAAPTYWKLMKPVAKTT
jgi:hypothetical protein